MPREIWEILNLWNLSLNLKNISYSLCCQEYRHPTSPWTVFYLIVLELLNLVKNLLTSLRSAFSSYTVFFHVFQLWRLAWVLRTLAQSISFPHPHYDKSLFSYIFNSKVYIRNRSYPFFTEQSSLVSFCFNSQIVVLPIIIIIHYYCY